MFGRFDLFQYSILQYFFLLENNTNLQLISVIICLKKTCISTLESLFVSYCRLSVPLHPQCGYMYVSLCISVCLTIDTSSERVSYMHFTLDSSPITRLRRASQDLLALGMLCVEEQTQSHRLDRAIRFCREHRFKQQQCLCHQNSEAQITSHNSGAHQTGKRDS